MSGTADLASSTKTKYCRQKHLVKNYDDVNWRFGIREFAMVAMMNGITLHTGIKVCRWFPGFLDCFKAL